MNVRELIELLQQCDPDAIVLTRGYEQDEDLARTVFIGTAEKSDDWSDALGEYIFHGDPREGVWAETPKSEGEQFSAVLIANYERIAND